MSGRELRERVGSDADAILRLSYLEPGDLRRLFSRPEPDLRLEKEAPTLSEAERSRRQRELVEQDRDLQRKRREFQEDLNQRKNEELAAVVERANRVIKQIFDQEKYDLILQEVVFAGPKVDITDKVIKALNASPPSR